MTSFVDTVLILIFLTLTDSWDGWNFIRRWLMTRFLKMLTMAQDREDLVGDSKFHYFNRKPPTPEIKIDLMKMYGSVNDDEILEADVISSMEFHNDGTFLAVGDKGGRIMILESGSTDTHNQWYNKADVYKQIIQFHSHYPEFDYLKSLDIEGRIADMKWVPRNLCAHLLLACNERTIKLWRVGEKTTTTATEDSEKLFPKVVTSTDIVATNKKCYSNAHAFHINSLSVNSDQETFVSSDDLRINLWNMDVTNQSFTVVDIKPSNMEDLQEVITSTTFHPLSCNLMAYSTSRGATKLCDLRDRALCDGHSKMFANPPVDNRGFYSEIVHSIADVKFSHSGRYVATRDYMNIKVWDTHMESKPMNVCPVHEYLEPKLSTLYHNDAIFDKFTISWNSSDTKIISGTYHDLFCVFDRTRNKSSLFQASRDLKKKPSMKPKRVTSNIDTVKVKNKDDIHVDCLDLDKKALVCKFNPEENTFAVASSNNFYIFNERR